MGYNSAPNTISELENTTRGCLGELDRCLLSSFVQIVTTPSQGHPRQSLRLLWCLVSSLRLPGGKSVDSDGQCGKLDPQR